MNRKEAIEIIRKEYLCVDHDCDIERNCGKCDLVMPSKEPILEAYKMAMNALAELKTGCWIDIDSKSFEFHRVYKCSECGNTEIEYPEEIYRRFRYCPNCGVKMVEPQESEKIDCKAIKCENCINHSYCDYEPQESEDKE